jgi:uncharacterized protein (TIRG00374 family)
MRRRLPRWAKIAIEVAALGLLGLLFVRILEREEVPEHLQRITTRTVVGVLAFQLVIQGLATFQWGLVLREAGMFRGPWQAFTARLAGFAVTYLTPSMYFGGEPVRASVYKREGFGYRKLYATIVLDKYIELSTKFPCIIAGFAILVVLIKPSAVLVSGAGAVLAFLLGFFVLLVVRLFDRPDLFTRFVKRLVRPLARFNRRLAVRGIVAMKEFARDVAEIMAHRRVFYLAMLTGVTVAVVEVLQTFFILGELDPSWTAGDRLARSFVIFATVFIQALVGILPGNLGGMEGTHLVIFNVLGIGSARSLIYTIILRIGQMSMVLLGILSIVAWRVRRAERFASVPERRSPAVVKRGESPLQGHLRKGADRNRTDA